MSLQVIDGDRFMQMEQVASMRMQGRSDTEIAKQLGLTRKVVVELFNDWKDVISEDSLARDTARDYLNQMVQHYDKLIKKYYELLEDLNNETFSHQVAGQVNSALKQIADLEAKRVDALQKAGLLDAADLGDELAEREEREAMLIDILRNYLCDDCRVVVAGKLQEVTKQVEVVKVYDE